MQLQVLKYYQVKHRYPVKLNLSYHMTAHHTVHATCILAYDNNNHHHHDNVYGAVIMAEPLQEFTRFI